jgi:hypothetical protein
VAAGRIGEIIQNTTVLKRNPAVGDTIMSITIPFSGVYIITINIQIKASPSTPMTSSYFQLHCSVTDNILYVNNVGVTNMVTSGSVIYYGIHNTWIVSPVSTGTYNFKALGITGDPYFEDGAKISAVRIG